MPEAYWAKLLDAYPASLINALTDKFRSPNPILLTPQVLAAEIDVDEDTSRLVLEQVVTDGFLTAEDRLKCRNCSSDLHQDHLDPLECPACSAQFDRSPPIAYRVYVRGGRASRDACWMIAVHGMNTRGEWQQDFSWRLAKLYGYAVPVAIYKYGRILFSPLLIIRQRRYRSDLRHKIQQLRAEMRAEGYGDRPDVIAHSFGTWLLAQALVSDRQLRLGRVILTGSIVRPDFAWGAMIAAGQVEAVMCHYGRRDIPVRLSQFVIPASGPSGFLGFSDRQAVVHWVEPSFLHSDYFKVDNMQRIMEGVWSRFLASPPDQLANLTRVHDARAPSWKPSRWRWLSHLLKYILLLIVLGLFAFVLVSVVVGVFTIVAVAGSH